ncbi:MAG: class I adenylate-forming enzyme family protein, partial [Panacagrimonas sp.]
RHPRVLAPRPRAVLRLEQWCTAALARPVEQPAIEFERRWHSWGELSHVARKVEALIEACGAPADAKVALIARNHPAVIAALLGLLAQGRSIRMVYAFQSATALAAELTRIDADIAIGQEQDLPPSVRNALDACGTIALALKDMDADAVSAATRSRVRSGNRSQPANNRVIQILTSGTTGPPKPFAIDYDLIARHFLGGPVVEQSEAPPALLYFPLGNITGIYSMLPTLLRGQRAVLLERFSVAGWHDHLLRYRPEAGGLPPDGVRMVLDAGIPPADLACLRRIGTGAAPLDPTVQREFERRYKVPILLSYGATEFGGPVTAMTLDLHPDWGERKLGSVGRPLPGAQLQVIDPQTRAVLPAGVEGVLEVISPRIGTTWIRTSDLAVIDEDGFVFLRGRSDGAIMRGGFKLLPETIERVLILHPSISAAAVIGIADTRLSQVPAAAIQLKPGAPIPSPAELDGHVREHLPATHVPTRWRVVEELPRTPSFKISRPALRELFESDS